MATFGGANGAVAYERNAVRANNLYNTNSQEQEKGDEQQHSIRPNGGVHLHKHTPSLQLTDSLANFASDPSTPGLAASSLYREVHQVDTQRPSHSHEHSHSHSHQHGFSEVHNHASDRMMSQDLRHAMGDEFSSFNRAYFSKSELLVSLLISLPYAFLSLLTYSTTDEKVDSSSQISLSHTTADSFAITSIALLLIGMYGVVVASQGEQNYSSITLKSVMETSNLEKIALRVASLLLPFYSASKIGNVRLLSFLLSAIIARIYDGRKATALQAPFNKTFQQHKFLSLALLVQIIVDCLGLTSSRSFMSLCTGYVALIITITMCPTPFPVPRKDISSKFSAQNSTEANSIVPKRSILISSSLDAVLTIASGALSAIGALALYFLTPAPTQRDFFTTLGILSGVSMSLAVSLLFAYPPHLATRYKAGYVLALCLPLLSEYYLANITSSRMAVQAALIVFNVLGTIADSFSVSDSKQFHRRRGNSIIGPQEQAVSDPTSISRYLINRTIDWPILHSILAEDDSRPVFYFMLLNLVFMGIQAFYSIVTGSLGLLSDSIHMFFDCFALAVGLAAAVMSKWPPSTRFPYGYGMLNVLAGFGNGVFLMLISIEIVYEAFERLVEGVEMNRLKELFIVSVLGMLVNLVGLVAMPHHHHHGNGHDHGHSHGHSHGHGHGHSHEHGHSHSHSHSQSHAHEHGTDYDHISELEQKDSSQHELRHKHSIGLVHSANHLHPQNSYENFRQQNGTAHSRNFSASPSIPEPSPLGIVDINVPQRLNPLHEHTHSRSPSLFTTTSREAESLPQSRADAHAYSHADHSHGHNHGRGHGHSHMNENMLGIWLHIAADALGSLSVVISTVLIHFTTKSFWDPVASILIAALIFASAVPLVKSCASRLLLTNGSELEFDLKEALQSVSGLRGVDGVCVPKFWTVEGEENQLTTHGVLHVIAGQREQTDELRQRVESEFRARKMDVLVQVERESEGRCWCGGGRFKL